MTSLETLKPAIASYEIGELHFSRRVDAARLIKRLVTSYFSIADFHEGPALGLEAVSLEGDLLGVSWLRYPDEKYDADMSSAELGYLAVDIPYQRGFGIGSALLRGTEERARQEGMEEVWLHSVPEALRFYERHGYARLSPWGAADGATIPMAKPL